jgi:hypothetical protein
MPRPPGVLSGVVLAAAVVFSAAAQPPATARRFDLYATILDDMGVAAAAVEPLDLQITESGRVARVVRVEPLDWPLSVQLLVDNGPGLERQNIIHLRNGARGFFEALPARAAVTFVTTAPQPRFLVREATSRDELLESIGRLGPDDGAGHLMDSLNEATARIERGPAERFGVIVAVATAVGDADVRERDLAQVMRRLATRAITVHVVQYSGGAQRTAMGGANQKQIGLSVTKFTNGRYEAISASSRLATLLPEIGEQIASSFLDGRFRITVERPPDASGQLGDVRLATRRGLRASAVSFDARLP